MKWLAKILGQKELTQDSNNETRELLKDSLKFLEECGVVKVITNLRLTGIPNDDSNNPIIKWIYRDTGLAVLLRHDYINDSIEIKVGEDVYGFFGFLKLSEFLVKFDDEQYPQLLDRNYLAEINTVNAL